MLTDTLQHLLDKLEESQWWIGEKHREHQFAQLRHLVQHAYEHVPFYRQRLDEHGLQPER